jgi:hypothetical protein
MVSLYKNQGSRFMTKTFLFLFATFFFSTSSPAAVPNLALTWDTNVTTIGMTSSQEAKIQGAERKMQAVIASDAFRTKILNHTYGGRKTFVNNNGLTNSQIYIKMLEGAEKLKPAKNNTMDLTIKTYYENSSTVGYTMTGSSTINMNTKFLNSYTSNNVSRNMIHEWLHKIGFGHAVSYSTSRDYSVPYAVGRIMEQLAANY